MSSKGIARYDQYLTNLALSYPVGNLIADIICPRVPVENFSDKVFVDADDAIMQMNDDAESTPSNKVDFAIGTPYSYRTRRRALSSVITNKEAQNAKQPVKLQQRETNKLTHRLRLKHELRVAEVLRDTSLVTQYTDVESITNAQWDDASPDPESEILTAVKTIYDNTGAVANTIIIPFEAGLYLAKQTWVRDMLKYQYGMELFQSSFQGQVQSLVGLPPVIKGLNVVVSNGRAGDYNKGETASVGNTWGKDVLIGYVPQNPGVDEMFGVLTMEYDPLKIYTENQTDPDGLKILAEWDYDILQAELKTWYLLQNVID
jgi:hypothetical protein